jgi:hypothetical protein
MRLDTLTFCTRLPVFFILYSAGIDPSDYTAWITPPSGRTEYEGGFHLDGAARGRREYPTFDAPQKFFREIGIVQSGFGTQYGRAGNGSILLYNHDDGDLPLQGGIGL